MSEISLKQLRCFVAVYTERSFTRAAKRLGLAQSPVSQAVAALESQLGVVLFERGHRDVTPTAAAEALYPEAVEIRRRAEGLQHLAATAADGAGERMLRIGSVSSAFTSSLPALLRSPPLAPYTVDVVDGGNADLVRAVDEGDLDVALLRDLSSDSDRHAVAFRERLCVAIATGDALASHEIVTADDLRDTPLVLFDRERAPLAFDLTAGTLLRSGAPLRIASRVSSEQAMLGLVSAGLGVALVPESLAVDPWHGVVFRELEGAEHSYPLAVRVTAGDPLGLLEPLCAVLRAWATEHALAA
ncbi:LysR family transcriptional regulator [Pseudoclavibacter chungangensis]|uniref:LysR family transcriptional regulator n=1 Tax=Pseudoclavibacter chungangensis TaxID=587635 RepID=A0A7J5BN68_9MICO|nr:LysR family transcriptional regulator [Pseudoclavibacter chungangensis]KAB1653400.1 LysR family transcriptional regulator [Pseudoclavibacter chungangensis]KAB1657236.1 LysR family transcriptional regulator [Pseudoclavibacter chungangensis]NYJ66330.1 DNA-binding transcriptional LysR family regulator [Pseudoclavibacter chungangensis]